MNQKPDSCKNCPLYKTGMGFVPDEERSSQVAILALSPSKDDVQGRHLVGYAGPKQPIYQTTEPKPFIGSAGWLLENTYLPSAKLSRKDVSLHHILKCYTPHPPTGDTLLLATHHCVKQHLNISDKVKLIITLGQVPWEIYQGTDRPLNDWRGFLGKDIMVGDDGKV